MVSPIVGIDYGSKVAGTTVVAWSNKHDLHLDQSVKKQDADKWLHEHIQNLKPEHLFIDAPLSLPGRILGLDGFEDYFYRIGDKQVKAMSPMFIGGLTARAIQFKDVCISSGFVKEVKEVYPGGAVRHFNLFEGNYKIDLEVCAIEMSRIFNEIDIHLNPSLVQSWHQLDACIAYWIGFRYLQGDGHEVGEEREGTILF
jgi:predicted nuclease with RNAse H fold